MPAHLKILLSPLFRYFHYQKIKLFLPVADVSTQVVLATGNTSV